MPANTKICKYPSKKKGMGLNTSESGKMEKYMEMGSSSPILSSTSGSSKMVPSGFMDAK